MSRKRGMEGIRLDGSIALKLLLVLAVASFGFILLLSSRNCFSFNASAHCSGRSCFKLSAVAAAAAAAAGGGRWSPQVEHKSKVAAENGNGDGSATSIGNIVFGIAATARLWNRRKNYVKLWWRPNEMRGFVWLDASVKNWSSALPPYRISESTDSFRYTHRGGRKAAIRISRIVSETFRIGLPDVHWFVMGDDDTMFVPDNLVKLLSKYDHRKPYYIGSSSESHRQNLMFSYGMAYGGGGFAISYSLAKALEQGHDECLRRYPYLYGSDDRMHACMSELGVPLTREVGFHQFDVLGDVSGYLAAHPTAPFVSMHHLDLIRPLFPGKDQFSSLKHLRKAVEIDPAGIFQQSVCYERKLKWTVSVSWGYVVQVSRGLIAHRDLETPMRTFATWNRRYDDHGYTFKSRAVPKSLCERPLNLYMEDVKFGDEDGLSSSRYANRAARSQCRSSSMASPDDLKWVDVLKMRVNSSWFESPRRQCCRISNAGNGTLSLYLRDCKDGELVS